MDFLSGEKTSMSSWVDAQPARLSSLGVLAVVLLALTAGIAVLAFGVVALLGVLGVLAFILFLRAPIVGVFATTALLLLSGSAGVIGPTGPQIASYVTVAKLCGVVAFAAWIVNFLVRRLRYTLTREVVLMVAFLLWALVGVLYSPYCAQQLPEWFRFASLIAFLVMTADVLSQGENSRRNVHNYIILLLVCGAISASFALVQYLTPSRYAISLAERFDIARQTGAVVDPESMLGIAPARVSGRALHSNWLALLMLCVLPLNVYWFQVSKTWRMRGLICAAAFIELCALVLTFTRTGFMVGCVLIIVMALKGLLRANPYRFVALALVVVLGWTVLPAAYKERVLNFSKYSTSESVGARVELQSAAWRYATEHPICGVGLGGFGMHFIRENSNTAHIMKYAVEHFRWNPLFVGVHDLYLQIACETGFIGLAVFLVVFVLMMRNLWVAQGKFAAAGDEPFRVVCSALQVSLVAFLLCSVFLHALQQKILWIVAAAAITVSLHESVMRSPEHKESERSVH